MRMAIVAALAACSSGGLMEEPGPDAGATGGTGAGGEDATAIVDGDGDRLDDAWEERLAREYLPFLSLDPEDGCPRSGLVARVREHPADATKIVIVYSHLFEHDCGINGHVGDNEAFGIAIDPSVPAPAGILAIRTASHQNTPCERVTECSTCGDGRPACDRAADGGGGGGGGATWPVVYASKDKHGHYATRGQCPLIGTCLDRCTLASVRVRPPVVHVGEPTVRLVHDLTAQGFITLTNGWTEPALMAFDPWDAAADFGGAGNVAADLVDPTFVPGVCP